MGARIDRNEIVGSLEALTAARVYVAGVATVGDGEPAPGPEIVEDLPVPAPAAGALAAPDDEWAVNLYAPRLDLSLPRDTTLVGSLFVGSVVSLGDLLIQYDPRVVERDVGCDE